MRNYVKVKFSWIVTDPDTALGFWLDINFANDEEEAQIARDGWLGSYRPTFPNCQVYGSKDCWCEVDDKANFVGLLNNARASFGLPIVTPRWMSFEESPRSSGENSLTEKKGFKKGPKGKITLAFPLYLTLLYQTYVSESKFGAADTVLELLALFEAGKISQQ